MDNKQIENKTIIGREEWCAFGAFNIPAILARVDSGAKTSSIQATEIELFQKQEEDWVRFTVYPLQGNNDVYRICEAKVYAQRSIKSSIGIAEERVIIKTPITIGDETHEISLSLANRNNMEYKMLLGREAMFKRYLINPSSVQILKNYTDTEIAEMHGLDK